MKKLNGLTRKGNVITVQCENRNETVYVFDRIAHYIELYRMFSGSQWSEEVVEALKPRMKKNVRAKHVR